VKINLTYAFTDTQKQRNRETEKQRNRETEKQRHYADVPVMSTTPPPVFATVAGHVPLHGSTGEEGTMMGCNKR
jgi:hypothetical protein